MALGPGVPGVEPGSLPAGGRRELLLATLLYAALTLALAWPLSVHPAGRVVWIGADTELFLWTLAWDAHALATNPLRIFDANIFHPFHLTLAYSENLIGSSLFAAPVIWLTGNIVLGLNVVLLLSCVLCGTGAYLLARRVGVGRAGAVVAGIVFAFVPPRFGRIGQAHLTTVQWIPFALAAAHAYLERGRSRDLKLAAAFFSLQAVTSGHGGTFLLIALAGLAAWHVLLGEKIDLVRRARDLGLGGLALLAPAVLVVVPYRLVQLQELGLRRPLDATWWSDWKSAAVAWVATPAHIPKAILAPFVDQELLKGAWAFLFPGFIPVLLAIAAFAGRARRDGRGVPEPAVAAVPDVPSAMDEGRAGAGPRSWRWLALTGIVAGIASLGLAVAVAVSGRVAWRAGEIDILRVRTPGRPLIAGLVLLAVGMAAGWRARLGDDLRRSWRGWAGAWRRTHAAWRAWASPWRTDARYFYAALTLGTAWLSAGAPIGPWPHIYWMPGLSFIRVPSRFTIVTMLGLAVLAGFGIERLAAGRRPRVRLALAFVAGALLVAECAMVPLGTAPYRVEIPAVDRWLATRPKPFVIVELPVYGEADHTAYMLHSTAHWQPTVNGYSGLRPPLTEQANQSLRRFPNRDSLETLARLGVTYVVVHGEHYRGAWPEVEQRIKQAGDWLKLEFAEGTGRVYSVHPPAQ